MGVSGRRTVGRTRDLIRHGGANAMDPVGRTKFGVLALGSIAAALILWLSASFWHDAWRQHEDAQRLRQIEMLEHRIVEVTRQVTLERSRTMAASATGDPVGPDTDGLVPERVDRRLSAVLADIEAVLDAPGTVGGLQHSRVALELRIEEIARVRSRFEARRVPDGQDGPAPHDELVDALHTLRDGLGFEPRTAVPAIRTLRRVRENVLAFAEAARRTVLSPSDGASSGEGVAAGNGSGLRARLLSADARDRGLAPALVADIDALAAMGARASPGDVEPVDRLTATITVDLHEAIYAAAFASQTHARRRLVVDTLLIAICFWIVFASLRLLRNVERQGWYDRVTDLPNRFRFDRLLDGALDRARNATTAVVVLDVDGFKAVNEGVGHGAGDALLHALGQRLSARLGPDGTLAALGADTFAAVLTPAGTAEQVRSVADALRAACRDPFDADGNTVFVTVSAGIALSAPVARGGPSERAAALLGRADVALHQAKDDGGDRTHVFDRRLADANLERTTLERELRSAVRNGELELHYQPKVGTSSGRVEGLEALVRWHHPVRGMVSPGTFIPLAERSGLICDLGAWVLDDAVRQTADWRRDGLDTLRIAVNISADQFDEPGFVERVLDTLRVHGLPADRLELEVTESVAMVDTAGVIERLGRLREAGISVAIDDFGTGYSSLQYLGELPLDVLKIDRAFVSASSGEGRDRSLARTIVMMARSLDLATVAEGVETAEQLAHVTALGCDCVQGFFHSKPVPAREVGDVIARIEAAPVADIPRAA